MIKKGFKVGDEVILSGFTVEIISMHGDSAWVVGDNYNNKTPLTAYTDTLTHKISAKESVVQDMMFHGCRKLTEKMACELYDHGFRILPAFDYTVEKTGIHSLTIDGTFVISFNNDELREDVFKRLTV